ncbi:MAG: GET complex subunit get1 [Bogoriella megaspora]|nr:MAG: GET complex subunit get1 [Bogoriella megaspora]
MTLILPLLLAISVAVQVFSTYGTFINEQLWRLYNRLPVATSKASQNQTRLRRELFRLNKEISGVSAQDEFSKWAKLRRQLDKTKAEHDKSVSSVESSKAKFDYAINIARWLLINGSRIILQYWYAREAMFWIPQGWVPGPVEYILAFPRAPRGSISIQIWQVACSSVTAMMFEAITALRALKSKTKVI